MHQAHRSTALSRRRLLTAIGWAAGVLALAGCASNAVAHRGLATVEVYDRDSGKVLPSYHKEGRQFVAGRPGARYALRVRNLTPARVLVVLSVDGVNVISGETADWKQTGYVLDPGRWADINGWRKSGSEIAAFEFAALEDSYAARTGRPDHVGVIGMAVFRERVAPPPPPPVSLAAPPMASRAEGRAADSGLGNAQAGARVMAPERDVAEATASKRLGTGHGQREWSVTRRTHFERDSSTPSQLSQIEYDSYDRLVAAGVIPKPYAAAQPRPFPSSTPGFAADPPPR